MAEEANRLVQPLVVPLPPLLDYSDDDGTVVGEDLDENALNSEEEGKMEEEDSKEDSSTMDVDGQGAGAAGGSGVVNEVFYSQPVATEPVAAAAAAAKAVGHVDAGRDEGPDGKQDSAGNEGVKQGTREEEGVLKERMKKEREDKR